MKVGILTYHFSNNYGALFQAYALRRWFIDNGYDAEFVNYHPDHVESGGELSLRNIFTKAGLKIIFLRLMSLKEKLIGNEACKAGFQSFKSEYLGIKSPEYKTISQIESAKLNYDLLVCGSDQIWNPSEQYGIDPVYFLDFHTSNAQVKKISYAPSFGSSSLKSEFSEEVSGLIEKLDAVSVREKSAIKIVEELNKKSATLVPDPTVLLRDYSSLYKEYHLKSDNYVFCYYLRSRHNVGEIAEKVASELGADLYSPHNPLRRWHEVGETVYPCPRQWLYLLGNSKFVITNSFHGTILSVLLNKPFIVIGIGGTRAKLSERVINLLRQTGLEERLVTSYDEDEILNLLNKDIRWDEVNVSVSEMRDAGMNYLKSQLPKA